MRHLEDAMIRAHKIHLAKNKRYKAPWENTKLLQRSGETFCGSVQLVPDYFLNGKHKNVSTSSIPLNDFTKYRSSGIKMKLLA